MKSSSSLIRTVSSPSLIKQEITIDRTRTVSLDGIDINEDEVFSQWNDDLNTSSSSNVDSKSIWKQIFNKPVKSKPVDDELKEQWSQLDKDQPSNHYGYNKPANGVKRTCPFYKQIPGKIKFSFINIISILYFRYYICC